MTETRRITFQGSGPLARALTQMLEKEGVAVEIHRGGPPKTEQHGTRPMPGEVLATLLASGTLNGIEKGIRKFRMRFPGAAKVNIEDEPDIARGPVFHRGRMG